MTLSRLFSRAVHINRAGSRSAFTSSKPDTANPNWLRVGLAFGTSALLWGLLFKQHSTDVHEYKVRNGLQ
ncbi:NADH dehydrogenase [ubiquinone] 1 subunit C1, mitochondrial [Fundulus heteroclitus]|uniref:NADH dehydrogenase [ubiquinone] 1 subunit C1, mitochondrial n=1 Tax=Fundulus heteroclitus TaxID=8078 RepID=A0A3Q2NXB3_FUNHE|nr:NADH dehydrogenase [ubiquinone] 1 subunit C1, mitochondrial [Fundulus heteroclitus]